MNMIDEEKINGMLPLRAVSKEKFAEALGITISQLNSLISQSYIKTYHLRQYDGNKLSKRAFVDIHSFNESIEAEIQRHKQKEQELKGLIKMIKGRK